MKPNNIKKILKKYSQILDLQDYFNPDIIIHEDSGFIGVGISGGDLEQINNQYNSWYNWKATNTDFKWLIDEKPPYFGYILSTAEKYIQYLFNVLENRFAIKTNLELENANHYKILEHFAKKWWRKIKREKFLVGHNRVISHIFNYYDPLMEPKDTINSDEIHKLVFGRKNRDFSIDRDEDVLSSKAKKIYQYDHNGMFLREYPSHIEAKLQINQYITNIDNNRLSGNWLWFSEYKGEKLGEILV